MFAIKKYFTFWENYVFLPVINFFLNEWQELNEIISIDREIWYINADTIEFAHARPVLRNYVSNLSYWIWL